MHIKFISTQRALAPTGIGIADYVINPYRGCLFGCVYCYAQTNKNVSHELFEWGEYVYVKQNIVDILKRELESIHESISTVLIGSTTDPLQPVEKDHKITWQILQLLKKYRIKTILLTRSPLISEYIELLDYSSENTVYFTFGYDKYFSKYRFYFSEEELLGAISSVNLSKVNLIVYISPVFPGVIDVRKLFIKLQGRTKKIYFEYYNLKLGNWPAMKKKLDEMQICEIETIMCNSKRYKNYWDSFIHDAKLFNEGFKYNLKFFAHPFNTFYNDGKGRLS